MVILFLDLEMQAIACMAPSNIVSGGIGCVWLAAVQVSRCAGGREKDSFCTIYYIQPMLADLR